jgi:anti-anti-sigma factor
MESYDQAGPSLTIECQDGTTNVLLAGEWDLCEAPQLREALDGINASQHVLFDLAGVTYLDSSTLRVFAEFKQRSKSLGGSTAIHYGGNERARKLMILAGVATLLH